MSDLTGGSPIPRPQRAAVLSVLSAIGLVAASLVLWYVWIAVMGVGLGILTQYLLLRSMGGRFAQPPIGFAVAFLMLTAVIQALLPLVLLRWRGLVVWATVTGLALGFLSVASWSAGLLGGHAGPGSKTPLMLGYVLPPAYSLVHAVVFLMSLCVVALVVRRVAQES